MFCYPCFPGSKEIDWMYWYLRMYTYWVSSRISICNLFFSFTYYLSTFFVFFQQLDGFRPSFVAKQRFEFYRPPTEWWKWCFQSCVCHLPCAQGRKMFPIQGPDPSPAIQGPSPGSLSTGHNPDTLFCTCSKLFQFGLHCTGPLLLRHVETCSLCSWYCWKGRQLVFFGFSIQTYNVLSHYFLNIR